LFIERTVTDRLDWVSLEPNDEPTWARIRTCTTDFLYNLFRQGAFQGTTPQEAFFAKCGPDTTTQQDIENGVINVVVGFAPLKPAEFVIITLRQLVGQSNHQKPNRGNSCPSSSSTWPSFTFEVEWDGKTISGITSVSGLDQITQVTEFTEGSEAEVRNLPGRTRYGPVVMTGLSPHAAFAEWAHAVTLSSRDDPPSYRKDVLIRRIDGSGQTTASWTLKAAWPSRYEGPTLNNCSNRVALEKITLETERIERSYSGSSGLPG